jgi:F0F1-type ATP synthase delta subunit
MIKKTKRKAFNFLRSYFDVFNELTNDKDKLDFLTAIINKQFLNEDPIELNFIVNLCYESQRHQIETSVKGWLRATKEELSPTLPTAPMTTLPTTPMTNGKEEEEEEKEEVKEKYKKFNFRFALISFGFKSNLVDEWLIVRKNKKLTNTETAFNKFIKQVELNGNEKNTILEKCIEKSWGGFESEWLKIETILPKESNDEFARFRKS